MCAIRCGYLYTCPNLTFLLIFLTLQNKMQPSECEELVSVKPNAVSRVPKSSHLLSLLVSMATGLGDDLWPGMGIRLGLSVV